MGRGRFLGMRLADIAYDWLISNHPSNSVEASVLWSAMQKIDPIRTSVSETRKTPRTTFMRDLRMDKRQRFVVSRGKISIRQAGG